jgi:hypothetical protein
MAGAKGVFNYVSDDGSTYRIKMDASNAAAIGNVAATSAVHMPGGYHPRYILATNATTGRERKLVVGSPTNALFVGGTSTVTIEDYSTSPSAQVAHDVLARIGERRLNQ